MKKKKVKCNRAHQKCFENYVMIKVILNWKKTKNVIIQKGFNLHCGVTDIVEISIGMGFCYSRSTKHYNLVDLGTWKFMFYSCFLSLSSSIALDSSDNLCVSVSS